MEFGSQLKILLYKNLLLKKKSKVGICCEIVFPLVIVGILFMILGLIQSFKPDYDLSTVHPLAFRVGSDNQILYGPTPLSADEAAVLLNLQTQISVLAEISLNESQSYFLPFSSSTVMEAFFANHSKSIFAGIWFNNTGGALSSTNPFSYAIRMDADNTPATDDQYNKDEDAKEYTSSGFESLQVAMDQSIMNHLGVNVSQIAVGSKRYPNPYNANWQSWNDGRDAIYKNAGGVFITAALFIFSFRLITELVIEKETKIREGMKMMGMNDLPYFLSWTITSLMIGIPVTLIVYIMNRASNLVYHTDWGTLVVLYLFYLFTLILIGFIASIFFNNSKFAGILTFIAVLVLAVIGIFISKADMSKSVKYLLSLISPIGFACANYEIATKDLIDVMAHPTNNTSVGGIILMMLVDIVLYLVIYWYLNNIVSGEFGTSKPWNFCFKKSYWISEKKDPSLMSADLESFGSNEDIESIPTEVRKNVTVSIRSLRKEFQTGNGLRVAVDELSLDMYSDQIHAFLGHNGAGKSTTIGMLTGLLPPTSGDAWVQGYSINSQMNNVRRTLGVCPQHDIIWKELTVLEHLKIYAALKGLSGKQVQTEAEKMAQEIGLAEKINAQAGTLSGGQKRKLCLGIAFIGRSEVIFLDEVTTGMDPLSRRGVWDFLLKYKQGRTIILTTHFMDEADFLGDRIAIISHGRLRCDGSSLFLKKKFGIGYLLTLAKIPNACNSEGVTNFIQQHIQEAVVLSDAGTELSYRLPTSSVDQFVPFFKALDQQKQYLGVGNYGISVTTMEEVFLRIGQEGKHGHGGQFNINANENHNEEAIKRAISTSSVGVSWKQQLKGLIIKRLHTSKKDLKSFFLTILVPAVIICSSIVVYKELRIDGDYFNNVTVPLTFSNANYDSSNIIPINVPGHNYDILKNAPYGSELFAIPSPYDMSDYLKKNFVNSTSALNFTQPISDQQLAYNVYYNKGYLHATPTQVNFVHDAILRNKTNIGITTSSAPFPHVLSAIEAAVSSVDMNAVVYFTILFMGGYSLMAASFAGNMCVERVSNIKRLLYISGCKKYVYWLSNLLWDYLFAIVLVFIVSGVLAGVESHFADQFGIILLAQLLFAFGAIPFSYILSYKYTTHGKATGAIFGIHFGIGLVMLITSINLRIQTIVEQSSGIQTASDVIDYIFYAVSPIYALGRIMIMTVNFPGTMRLGQFKIDSYWDIKVCGAPLIYLAGHAVVWTIWILLLDYAPEIKGALKNPKNVQSPKVPDDEDSDVTSERQRLHTLKDNDEVLVMRELHKMFPGKGKNPAKIAVNNTTLGIPRGQTFGLLGMNGAGKTTTLSMLSGDLVASAGSATINGFDLISQRSKALRSIGSCPQFDALIPLLSGREQLWLYCRIKGIPEHQIGETVEAFLSMMDLQGLGNTNTGGYSGGNKRKVSLSIAMLGNPSVVFLDEPSSGCDPQVRRFMWNVISELGANKVIIITTHSMEECEALCQRVSIMKDGKFTCLGSIQHVKSKFGSGYSIDFKLKKEYLETGIEIIERTLPGIELLDRHDLIVNFELPSKSGGRDVKVSDIFDVIQQQLHFMVEDYSVSQTSLEQVFLKLTSATYEARLNQLSESQQNQPLYMN
ncbi:ABC transporter A family protein [Heterostelium album PN500]|uniref:ABC transporter A family protein n=1 Tax=Heterostelium pallidum (strain ATCC 26659 / Pp 5 / PN500) TaxID=670386 RepID=D3BGA0_HETP5|nr:ABC transporter A family protein [Heterostelium album PN500]EFA79500.1 ABC transporter A family protein [Heterostelium album PN500]|eukprot:XP_020431621.1 ABC transporter A family protein [Heterostelium album PN500]